MRMRSRTVSRDSNEWGNLGQRFRSIRERFSVSRLELFCPATPHALKRRVAAALVVVFATASVAPGEAGPPGRNLAEQLRADTAAGVVSRDEAAIYAFLARFARDKLPPIYKSLPVDVPDCATGLVRAAKDAATRVDLELSEAFEAAMPEPCSGSFAYSIRSSVYPLIVHYEDAALAAHAADMLRLFEEQWDLQVLTMGQTAPLLDGGACGPDENIDLYLLPGLGTFVDAAAPNPATFHDDWSTFTWLDSDKISGPWGGRIRAGTVAHEFQHMLQAADDWYELDLFETTSTLMEDVVRDHPADYYRHFWEFASRPHQPLEFDDFYQTRFNYGKAMYAFFLRDRYFGGDASFIADFWRNTRSQARGCSTGEYPCYIRPERNEPDIYDAIDAILGAIGPYDHVDSLIEFSRWRWYVGRQDDGNHFEEGGLWPNTAIPPYERFVRTSWLPLRLDDIDGPMTNGVVYVWVRPNQSTRAALSVGFEGAPGYRWHVEALRDLPGTADIWTPGIDGTEGSFLVSLEGASRVMLKVLNLAFEGYDPDYLVEQRLPFVLDLDLVLEIVDVDIKPGSDPNSINPSLAGDLPVAILGSASFDVADVDVTTLAFGPDRASFDHSQGPHFQDVDGDGTMDLLAHFRVEEAGIEFGDTQACVIGEKLDITPFEGCDAIRTVPDMDGDKLLDVDEAAIGTDALNPDTDGDGFGDGREVLVMGTDPLDPLDPEVSQVGKGARRRSKGGR